MTNTKLQESEEKLKSFNKHFLLEIVPIGCAGNNPEFAELCATFEEFKTKYAKWINKIK